MKKLFFTPVVSLLLFCCLIAGETGAQPLGWQYFTGIPVTENSGNTLTNYQLRLTLNTQALVNAGQMLASGDDIRFGSDVNGVNQLSYWIESGMNTAGTVIWVKVASLPANATTTIYLFYGNNAASGISSIDGTFIGPHSSTDSVASGGAGGVGNSQRGFRFAPTEDILVKSFGKREPTGTTRYVTLFDFNSQTILRQHQVNGPAGQYYYSDLSQPIWLTQSTQYLLELFQGNGDGYYFGVSSQVGQHIVYYDMRYCNSCTQNTFPTNILGNYQYGYPDFHYYTKSNVSPAPTYELCPPETCDGIDNNCNGMIDEGVQTTYYRDQDGDGFGNPSNTTQACSLPPGYVANNTDCNDNNALEKPGQIWYADLDNDGYGTGATLVQCLRPGGYKVTTEMVATTGDCNDGNAAINPAATEVCDGIDNNCNGSTDEGVLITYYRDQDGDGFGNPSNTTQACSQPVGYVTNNQDCNDNNALEKPGQVWYKDVDNDGYAETGAATITQCLRPVGYKVAAELISTTGDCNDNNAAIKPGAAEICDGIDNNCNGQIDEPVAIASPWTSGNIGTGANGGSSQSCSPGNLTIYNLSAQGFSTPTSDLGHSVYQQLCGNASITVRIASLSGGGWAGIQMRESLAAGSRMVALKTQLANIGIREARANTNAPKQIQNFPATLLHEWLRITRSGNTFQYFISPDGTNWQLVGTVNIAMSSCLQVGMFVESINVNTTTAASFTNVSVSGGVLPLTGSPDTPTAVGVEKIHEFSLQVFPNPTTGEVNLGLKDYLGRAVRIEVYSMLGQMVRFIDIDEVKTPVIQLDLSEYQAGTFLIRVSTEGAPAVTKWVDKK